MSEQVKYLLKKELTSEKSEISTYSYFPFGMPMPNRTYSLSSSKYRFGFNTQEKDDEVYGEGNLNTAEFWQYDTRIGRRWNVDPRPNVSISPYATFANNPILNPDFKGDSIGYTASDGVKLSYFEHKETGYGFYDADGKSYSGNDKNVGLLESNMAKLVSGKRGNKFMNMLISEKKFVNIEITNNGKCDFDDKTNVASWDPSVTITGFNTEGDRNVTPFINLGHELAHGLSWLQKKFDHHWYDYPPNVFFGGHNLDEIYSTHIENLLRSDWGMPLRIAYGVTRVKNSTTGLDEYIPDVHSEFLFKQGGKWYNSYVTKGGLLIYNGNLRKKDAYQY